MLRPAISYKAELDKINIELMEKEEIYKYFISADYWYKLFVIDETEYNQISRVSVDSDGKVIGYIGVSLNKAINSVNHMYVCYFKMPKISYTFTKDVLEFIDYLFVYKKFNKIHWSVYIGNPAIKVYNKFIERYNGKIVGYFKDDERLLDNSIVDKQVYEIIREDYLKAKE